MLQDIMPQYIVMTINSDPLTLTSLTLMIEDGRMFLYESKYIYKSFHLPNHLSYIGSPGGAGANPGCHWARGRVHPGQVTSPSHGSHIETNKTKKFRVSKKTNLVCWGKPEYSDLADSRRACKLHTEILRPAGRFEPRTPLL